MILKLIREPSNELCTPGKLYVDDAPECDTLEDIVRPVKKAGQTAIPAGTYEIAITYSNRFKRPMPLLMNVPGFEGIRIHPGNTAADTEGCILVGTRSNQGLLINSRAAFSALMLKLVEGVAQGKIFIQISQTKETA